MQAWYQTKYYINFETYNTDISNMLVLVNGYTLLACHLFIFYTLIPVIGPIINIGVMYWVLNEMSRMQLPLAVTNEDIR